MRERLAAWLAPAILVALGLTQIGLAFGAGLSPWKGGGFGMFASTDHGGLRVVRAVAVGPAGERAIGFPSHLDRDRREARELPSARRLRGLAQKLAIEAPEADAIRIEVWRTVFAPDDLRPHRELLASVVRPAVP